ncbi:MAG: hypothetical protein HYR56_09100 [Acidobacteria bacterium]|nr:hypothetical protein [Acidobacteriota bacterium]MBI3422869.1 hypothetical protein [Acidobacteriota bacterium]
MGNVKVVGRVGVRQSFAQAETNVSARVAQPAELRGVAREAWAVAMTPRNSAGCATRAAAARLAFVPNFDAQPGRAGQ